MKKSIGLILTFIFILIVIFDFAFYTNAGLKLSLNIARYFTHDQLKIGAVQGTLASYAILKDVSYKNDSSYIKLQRLELFIDPYKLFVGKLKIHYINIDNIEIKTFVSNDNQINNNLFNKVLIENADIKNINIHSKDNAITIRRLINYTTSTKRNNFLIKFSQGGIFGNYYLKNKRWDLQARGIKINTNELINGLKSNLSFYVTSTGDFNQFPYKATLNLTNLTGTLHTYVVSGDANIDLHNGLLNIHDAKLNLGSSVIKIQGIAGKDWDLHWNMYFPELKTIYPGMQGTIENQGTITTKDNSPYIQSTLLVNQLQFKDITVQSLQGNIDSNQEKNIQLNLQGKNLKIGSVLLPQAIIKGDLKFLSDKIHMALRANFSPDNILQSNFIIDRPRFKSWNDLQLTGSISSEFKDIKSFISFPNVKDIQGTVRGKVVFEGRLLNPKFNGTLQFNNGKFYVPPLGIHPVTNLSLKFSQEKIVDISGNMISGQGNLALKGSLNLNKENFPLNLTIKGNNFQAANTQEYKITASPQLTLLIDGSNATLSGNLLLPYLNIELKNYNQAVTLPDELEFVGEKQQIRYFQYLKIGLQLQLGEYAHLIYKNLRAKLAGRIYIYQTPGGLPSGQGALIIREGTYRIYNKLFTIENGKLVYAGNLLVNPGLSIKAVKQSSFVAKNFLGFNISTENDNMQVGISISGTLTKPVIALYSEPPLNQDDILSYIVFGQPRSQISGISALSLLGSLSTNMDGPTEGNEASENNASSSVSKMSLDPTQAFNFSLPLSKRLQIRTETTFNEVGADILYIYNSDPKKWKIK